MGSIERSSLGFSTETSQGLYKSTFDNHSLESVNQQNVQNLSGGVSPQIPEKLVDKRVASQAGAQASDLEEVENLLKPLENNPSVIKSLNEKDVEDFLEDIKPFTQEGDKTTPEAGAQATPSSTNASAMQTSEESTTTSSSNAAQPGSADQNIPPEGAETIPEAGAQATSNLDAASQVTKSATPPPKQPIKDISANSTANHEQLPQKPSTPKKLRVLIKSTLPPVEPPPLPPAQSTSDESLGQVLQPEQVTETTPKTGAQPTQSSTPKTLRIEVMSPPDTPPPPPPAKPTSNESSGQTSQLKQPMKATPEADAQVDAANQDSTVAELPDQAPQSKQVTKRNRSASFPSSIKPDIPQGKGRVRSLSMTHKTPSSEPLSTNASAMPISEKPTTTSSSSAAQPSSADQNISSLINQINSNDIKDDILQKACEFLTEHYNSNANNDSLEINQLISALENALAHMKKTQLKLVKDELKGILKQIDSNRPLFNLGIKLYETGIYKNKVSRIFGQIESETYRHLCNVKTNLANSDEATTNADSEVASGAPDGSLETESQKVALINTDLSKEKTQQAISEFIGLSPEEKKSPKEQEKLLENFPKGTNLAGFGGLGFILIYNDIAFKIQRSGPDFREVAQKEFQAPKQVFENLTKMNKEQSFFKNAENSIIRTIEQKDYGSFAVTFMEALPITKDTDQLSDATRLNNFAQICHSVSSLHQAGWSHGDLKPENFAIIKNPDSSSYSTKIFDFNEAHMIGDPNAVIGGTQFWNLSIYHENTDKKDSIGLIRILIAEFIGQKMPYFGFSPIPKNKLEKAPEALKNDNILSGRDILIPETERTPLEKQLVDKVNYEGYKKTSQITKHDHDDALFLKSINDLYLDGKISEEKYRIAIQLLALNTDDPESRPSALQLMWIATELADYSDRKEKLGKTKEQLEKPNTLIPEESKEDFDVQSAFENAKELYPETMSLQIHHELVEAIESRNSEKIEASLKKILVYVSSDFNKSYERLRYGNTHLINTPTYGLALLYACSKYKEFPGVELNENTIPNWVQENPQAALSLILRAKRNRYSRRPSFSGTEAPLDMPMDPDSFELLLKPFKETSKKLSPEKWKECITYLDSQMAIDETIKRFLKDELGCPEEAFNIYAQPESPSQQISTSSTQSPLPMPNQPASESPKPDETSIATSTSTPPDHSLSGSPRQQNPKVRRIPPQKPLPPLPPPKR